MRDHCIGRFNFRRGHPASGFGKLHGDFSQGRHRDIDIAGYRSKARPQGLLEIHGFARGFVPICPPCYFYQNRTRVITDINRIGPVTRIGCTGAQKVSLAAVIVNRVNLNRSAENQSRSGQAE